MKKLYRVLAFICALVALFALFMIIKELCEREEDKKVFENVLSLALTPDGSEEEQSLPTPSVSEEESDIPPSINMSIVKEENPDWNWHICCPCACNRRLSPGQSCTFDAGVHNSTMRRTRHRGNHSGQAVLFGTLCFSCLQAPLPNTLAQ